MFPYPSGSGLHVGHPEGYTATDIVVRYNRMRGKHVLHPMGWMRSDCPPRNTRQDRTHPAVTTKQNIDTFRRQLKMLGFSYDWSRELSTTDPDYYRWTQWIFLQFVRHLVRTRISSGPVRTGRCGRGRVGRSVSCRFRKKSWRAEGVSPPSPRTPSKLGGLTPSARRRFANTRINTVSPTSAKLR